MSGIFQCNFILKISLKKGGEMLGCLSEGSNGGSSVTGSIASSGNGGSSIGGMGNWGSGKGNLQSML
jgi:hypothetical protein